MVGFRTPFSWGASVRDRVETLSVAVQSLTQLNWYFSAPVLKVAGNCPQLQVHSATSGLWRTPVTITQINSMTIRASYGSTVASPDAWQILTTPVGLDPVIGDWVVPDAGTIP